MVLWQRFAKITVYISSAVFEVIALQTYIVFAATETWSQLEPMTLFTIRGYTYMHIQPVHLS